MLLSLLAVHHEQFRMQMTRKSKHQVAGNPRRGRFSTETPLEREHRLEIQRKQRREYRFNSRAEATPSTKDRGYSDQKHVQRQRQNTTITLQMKPTKSGTPPNTDASRKKIK